MHIDTYEHARIPPGERRNGQKGCVGGGRGGGGGGGGEGEGEAGLAVE